MRRSYPRKLNAISKHQRECARQRGRRRHRKMMKRKGL